MPKMSKKPPQIKPQNIPVPAKPGTEPERNLEDISKEQFILHANMSPDDFD